MHKALAPAGLEATPQAGAAAGLGPLLVQATVPVAVVPAGGLLGKPLTTVCISAWGTTVMGLVSVSLATTGSAVALPAVVVMFKGPPAGAVKLAVQVMAAPSARAAGKGLGVQLCVVPAGSPVNTQVGVAALLGPLLVQMPDTVTLWPALTLADTVVAAAMSARGTMLLACWAVLLAGKGSALVLPAVPTTVTVPLAGAV